jgi:hypothetical protein
MESIEEAIGQAFEMGGNRYLAINFTVKDSVYYFLCLSSTKPAHEKIFEMELRDGQLLAGEYNGKDHQALMEEFHKFENMKKCYEFMERTKESLSIREGSPD